MFVAFCLLQECEEHSSCQTEKISGEYYSSFVSFTFLETFQQQANTEIDQSSPCSRAGFGRGAVGRKGYLVLLELGTRKSTPVIAFFRVVQLFAKGVLGTVHGARDTQSKRCLVSELFPQLLQRS